MIQERFKLIIIASLWLKVLGLFCVGGAHAQSTCHIATQCSCKFDDGREISLWPIDKKGSPRFSVGEGDEYQYNPCTPFSNGEDVGECHNVLGCQYVMVGAGPFAIAYKEPMVVDYDSSIKMYTFTYTGSLDSETKSKRKMVIQLKCNTDASNPSLEAFKEAPSSTFTSTLTSKYACVVGKANVSTGLSVGSIICIVLFAILFVYFVFGIILNKYAFHKEGTDVIPQKSFWADIPHLVKDGARFSYQKIKGNAGQYEQI